MSDVPPLAVARKIISLFLKFVGFTITLTPLESVYSVAPQRLISAVEAMLPAAGSDAIRGSVRISSL